MTPRRNDRVASLRYRIRTRLIAPATAQRNIARTSRACSAGSALLELEDLDTGLFGVFVAPGVEVVVVVLLDEEEESASGRLGFVGLGETGVVVDVDVVGPGAGLLGEDEAAGDTGVGATGVDVGVVDVGVEVGLGVGVVLDPPVIVNCGLALPESPSTSGEKAHATNPQCREVDCVNMTVRTFRRREKELRTDYDVVGPIRNVRDIDLHRACTEREVRGEWVI